MKEIPRLREPQRYRDSHGRRPKMARRTGGQYGTSGLVAAIGWALAVASCGSNGNGGGDAGGNGANVSAWEGNWMESGTQSNTCGAASTTVQISEVVIISAGSKPGTVETPAANCTLTWDV